MSNTPLVIGNPQFELLEKLSNAVAVSGDEREVRRIVWDELEGIADDIKLDALGNVLARKNASADTTHPLNVMLDAHMDEVGFIIAEDEGDGIYSFEVVGGIDKRQLPAKMLWVGRDHLPGIIGTKPIHLMENGESKTSFPVNSLRIDLGPNDAGKVTPGDYAAFATRFTHNDTSLFGKALDDRIGVATLIELVKHAPPHINLLASFSVQEEIGLRGARVAAYSFDPDLAIAIDSTPAHDLPREDGEENTNYNCRLGEGPAIYYSDAGTVSDPRLIHHLRHVAEANSIPCQTRQAGGGGTDAGAIHKVRSGIPSVSISIPGRYAHSPALISRISDWQNTLNLVYIALLDLTRIILEPERN